MSAPLVPAWPPKVKPLEWRGPFPANGFRRGRWEAESFSVVREGIAFWRIYFGISCRKGAVYSTLEAAKAAAQADYERRILSALTPPEAD